MDDASEEEKRRHAENMAAMEARYAERAPAPAAAPAGDEPSAAAARPPAEQAGEASMSIAETNALRESLGLKPLVDTSAARADQARAEHQAHVTRKRARESAAESAELRRKLAEKKEQRRVEAELKKTTALGVAASAEDDDILVRTRLLCLPASLPASRRARGRAVARSEGARTPCRSVSTRLTRGARTRACQPRC